MEEFPATSGIDLSPESLMIFVVGAEISAFLGVLLQSFPFRMTKRLGVDIPIPFILSKSNNNSLVVG